MCLCYVPPQAGEVFYQQKINYTSRHYFGNLGQASAGEVKSAGVFCGNPYNFKALFLRVCL